MNQHGLVRNQDLFTKEGYVGGIDSINVMYQHILRFAPLFQVEVSADKLGTMLKFVAIFITANLAN